MDNPSPYRRNRRNPQFLASGAPAPSQSLSHPMCLPLLLESVTADLVDGRSLQELQAPTLCDLERTMSPVTHCWVRQQLDEEETRPRGSAHQTPMKDGI